MSKSESHQDNAYGGEYAFEDVVDGRLYRELIEGKLPDGADDRDAWSPAHLDRLDGDLGYSDDLIASVEVSIRTFQKCSREQAFNSLIDVMNGGVGGMNGLYHDDDVLRQGKIDLEALQLLFGVMLYLGREPREAAKLAYVGYWHYCNEDDDHRNFVDYPEAYRRDRLERAINGFDWGSWYRWRRWDHEDGFDAEEPDHWTDEYGEPCYKMALALVDIGCGELGPEEATHYYEVDLPTDSDAITELATGEQYEESGTPGILGNDGDDYSTSIEYPLSSPKIPPGGVAGEYSDSGECQYPSPKEVRELLAEIDTRSVSTFRTVLQRLQRDGYVKVVCLEEGVDYRIYPHHLPDPPEAKSIKFKGEEYEPGPLDVGEEQEHEIMTDGGVDVREPPEAPETHSHSRQNSVPGQDAELASTGSERESETDRPPPITP